MTLKKLGLRRAKHQYEAQITALRAECDALRAALPAAGNRQRTVGGSDYEWHVEVAAKGLAQRDKYPMPPWVTTREEFYEFMAGAALDATGLRDLLERIARAERNLEAIQGALNQADVNAENARHRAMTDGTGPADPPLPLCSHNATTSGSITLRRGVD